MKIRKLKMKDVFPMSRIIKKIGIKEIMKQATKNLTGKEGTAEAQKQVGTEMFAVILENLHLAETEVTAFLADLVGMKPEQFAELEFDQLASVYDQLKQLPGIASFLKQASQ
ncbi:hypothetical protein [Paenibacillus eucommiae]|uniref:Uncharacterized protein n=1 Tax=Paenibacillus eucommiae TaxID=1355755 RepID=A0ABS4J177_9BACL|nr:hypothetical protein [Paenibacillus eucommiae]MBP1992549.1 hypothetical protein [Paenibacillus eucommiae]